MMVVDNKYEFGETVYLKTDEEQKTRIVTSIKVFPYGEVIYVLSCGVAMSEHYDFEISKETNELMKVK